MESRKSMLDIVKNGLHSSGRVGQFRDWNLQLQTLRSTLLSNFICLAPSKCASSTRTVFIAQDLDPVLFTHAEQTTYRHRMLYAGEHKLGRGVEDFMKTAVSAQAEQPREEGLTGFLLVYQNHFIHVVEGSESTLSRHLRSVVQGGDETADAIGRVKVILEITHVNKRCFVSWSSRIATPPTLASQLKPGVAETARHADAVFNKTLRLLDALKKLPAGAPLSQHQALQLPEAELLQALLDSPLLPDARALLQEQRVPPRITLYEDVVWPMQPDFVPYNLLEEPIAVPSEAQLENAVALDNGEEESGGGDDERGSDKERAKDRRSLETDEELELDEEGRS